MNEVKRFVRWLIKNDLAFTNLDEAVTLFRQKDNPDYHPCAGCSYREWTVDPVLRLGSDSTTTVPPDKYQVWCATNEKA